MKLDVISSIEASALINGKHYLGPTEYQPTFCFATEERDAVAIYSPPVASHFKRALSKPLELIRLWQYNPDRPLSQFLATTLRVVRKMSPESDCIFSYADPGQINPLTGQPHKGTIYRATNFEYFGESRVTDYWLDEFNEKVSSPVMYRRHKTKSREKLTALGYVLVEKPPKHLYVYGLQLTTSEVRAKIGGRYLTAPALVV
jgi:hypothetical protein